MAKVHGEPGEWVRVKGVIMGLLPVFIAFFIAGIAAATVFFDWFITGMTILFVSLVLGCIGLISGFRRIERHYIGARGEERVSNILSGLSEKYHIFNDFSSGRHHIDHVVIGPAGVYVVETKFWRGRVTIEDGQILVNGVKPSRPPLKQVQCQTQAIKKELENLGWKGSVTALLVFASDSFVSHIAELNGVVVLNSSEIHKSFATNRIVIQPEELDRLVCLMESRI